MKVKLFLISLLMTVTCSLNAASKIEIDVNVEETLEAFYQHTKAGQKLVEQARGVLVFPKVYKAGLGVGGQYGEVALLVRGNTVGYYSTASASIGFQAGVQQKSQIILFMTDDALSKFRNSDGWEVGVDGSVAIVTLGVGEKIDTNTVQQPIIGFIFSNKGLMYNLTLEGSKLSKINR